jgi:hypothetical protein
MLGTGNEALGAPFFYQDQKHTFYVEPTLTETTIDKWEDWGINTLYYDPKRENEAWWKKVSVEQAVPHYHKPIPSDPYARYQILTPKDWVTDPRTVLQFQERFVARDGGFDLTTLATKQRLDGNGALAAVDGVELSDSGGVASGPQAGITTHSGGLNVVGGGGLNAVVLENINVTFNAEGGLATAALAGRMLKR